MVYNSQETIRKYRYWKERLPWIKVHYAVKANPTEVILKDLINEGSSFDCASKN
jgi:ornithine decarboxylase